MNSNNTYTMNCNITSDITICKNSYDNQSETETFSADSETNSNLNDIDDNAPNDENSINEADISTYYSGSENEEINIDNNSTCSQLQRKSSVELLFDEMINGFNNNDGNDSDVIVIENTIDVVDLTIE